MTEFHLAAFNFLIFFSCGRGHLTTTKPVVRVITNTFTSLTMTVAIWSYPCPKSIKETIERTENQTHFRERFFKYPPALSVQRLMLLLLCIVSLPEVHSEQRNICFLWSKNMFSCGLILSLNLIRLVFVVIFPPTSDTSSNEMEDFSHK